MTRANLPLRRYQIEAGDAIVKAWKSGMQRPAIVLPMGTGKTVIFSHLAHQWVSDWDGSYGRRVLILVHRDELVRQAIDKLEQVSSDFSEATSDVKPNLATLQIGIVKAEMNQIDADVIVGSVQTLRKSHRLDQLTDIGLVIVDEAHHAAADSYVSILTGLGCFDGPTKAVGFTATMSREDNKSLGKIWQDIIFQRDMLDFIPEYLVDFRGELVTIDGMSLTEAKVSRGDFTEASLTDLLLTNEAQNTTADAYLEHAKDRQGILFAPTVAAAQAFTDAFNKRGIKTEMVWGAQNRDDRRNVIHRTLKGQTQVMANCMVLTEGFDLPPLSCAVIARPTTSQALYVQMAGRVGRLWPGKKDALILDVVGASEDHRLATIADLSPDRIDRVEPGETLTGAATRLRKSGHPALVGYIGHRHVDLFQRSGVLWLQTEAGIWFVGTKDKFYALWPTNEPGVYDVGWWTQFGQGGGWLKRSVPLEIGKEWTETIVRDLDEDYLIRRSSSWRKRGEMPSDAQIRFAGRLGLSVREDMTKAELSEKITIKAASNRLDAKLPKGSQS